MSTIRSGFRGFLLPTLAGLGFVIIVGTASVAAADSVDATSTPDTAVLSSIIATDIASSSSETSFASTTTTDLSSLVQNAVSSTTIATTTPSVLTCTSAYTADLYDSPSGHAEQGASIIGTQSWTDCTDEQGNAYEFKIAPEEYRSLTVRDAHMPVKHADPSARLNPHSNKKGSGKGTAIKTDTPTIAADTATTKAPSSTDQSTATSTADTATTPDTPNETGTTSDADSAGQPNSTTAPDNSSGAATSTTPPSDNGDTTTVIEAADAVLPTQDTSTAGDETSNS